MTEIGPELVERMVGFVHRVIRLNLQAASLSGTPTWNVAKEAMEIYADLPDPVDPDLVEARRMESDQAEGNGFIDYAVSVRNGEQDNEGPVRCRYEGIKRGRELATPTLPARLTEGEVA